MGNTPKSCSGMRNLNVKAVKELVEKKKKTWTGCNWDASHQSGGIKTQECFRFQHLLDNAYRIFSGLLWWKRALYADLQGCAEEGEAGRCSQVLQLWQRGEKNWVLRCIQEVWRAAPGPSVQSLSPERQERLYGQLTWLHKGCSVSHTQTLSRTHTQSEIHDPWSFSLYQKARVSEPQLTNTCLLTACWFLRALTHIFFPQADRVLW